MLTPRQHRLLTYIHQRQQQDGITPSYDEMRTAIDLKSKSGIFQLITALENRGYIKRLHNKARALEIIKLPENIQSSSASTIHTEADTDFNNSAATELPFLGRIAAGIAIEAIEYETESVAIPDMLIGNGEHFVLEVTGDSMLDAGIHDGDYVLIRKQPTAVNGQIVVACIDDSEVTLKRFQTQGSTIALKPENADFQTQIFGGERISIKGILAGLVRKY